MKSILLDVVLCASCLLACCQQAVRADTPPTLYWDGARLADIREGRVPSAEIDAVLTALKQRAAEAKRTNPLSVVDNKDLPPGADEHDYISYGRYWWPNPDTEDGLPYIRKDGLSNHDLVSKGDRAALSRLSKSVQTLALASYLLHDRKAARCAEKLLCVWFLDPETRMNPRMLFGQIVPGRTLGRPAGLLDTRDFLPVLDSIILLRAAGRLDEERTEQLVAWFTAYADWLASSPLAAEERLAKNNLGAWFAAQEAGILLFLGRSDAARDVIARVRDARIPDAIEPNGVQPYEVSRTNSLGYSLFNLQALARVARYGEHVGVDLWTHTAENGASLKGAIEFVLPSLKDPSKWPYKNLSPVTLSHGARATLLLAARSIPDARFHEAIDEVLLQHPTEAFIPLLYLKGEG